MKRFIMICTALMLSVNQASAAINDFNIEKNFSNNKVIINGTALPDESVTVQILPKNISISEFTKKSFEEKKSISSFVYETSASETGEFSVTAGGLATKEYTLYAASADKKVLPQSKDFLFYSSDEYTTTINNLNAKENENGFVVYAESEKSKLGFDENINDIVALSDILKFMYRDINGGDLDSSKYVDNVYLYRNSFAACALNGNIITEVYSYVKNIIDADSTLKKYWDQYVTNDEVERFLVQRMSGRNITNVDNLKLKLQEGLILAATRYPNGHMSLKDLYSDYMAVIGINTVSSDSSVYSAVGSKDYASIGALKTAYDSAAGNQGGNGSGTGGGTGGVTGGGNKVTTGEKPYNSVVISGSSGDHTQEYSEIGLRFLDLSSFEWAYPSISRLFDEGVISGISDEQFAPKREVKREEFVKMIVCAMGLDMGTGNNFADVENTSWYAPYVYSAFNNGIINGISDNSFGVSESITRQDMAVMIYKAILLRGYENQQAELQFVDKDDISSYAKEAVEQLVSLGIISGMDNNRFAAAEFANRAQAAVIIERALSYLR